MSVNEIINKQMEETKRKLKKIGQNQENFDNQSNW